MAADICYRFVKAHRYADSFLYVGPLVGLDSLAHLKPTTFIPLLTQAALSNHISSWLAELQS